MRSYIRQPVAIGALFVWVGLVCAISFMEAWLKFKAPGVTLPVGLGIGRLVFGALNKVEWVLAITVLISLLRDRRALASSWNGWLLAVLVLLILQTVWLLPALDSRAGTIISKGQLTASPSSLHIFYIASELLKVGCLLTRGISLLRQL